MTKEFNPGVQNELAKKFHALHHTDEMLVLPNAWDAISARMFQETGFQAIATTSSGVSWACGYQDGEKIPPEEMLAALKRITRVVSIPVSADIEAGYYADDHDKFYQFICDVIEAGIVGINLEDADSKAGGMRDQDKQLELIRLARKAGNDKGVNIYINARTDAYERAAGDLDARIQACIDRAKAFEGAGADGIFVPFTKEMETIAKLKQGISLPLNILISNTLDVAGLRKLKVNRVTVGGKPILATLHTLRKVAESLKAGDDWSPLFVPGPTYPEVNAWFKE
ncbi:MAG: isocitrate lyase/phosphoenolpyruvate mutase family protein [Chitinophagaceae bacterium]|nr:isocitrate lyase/phosphoenolpyruvate mutase family protein [Chitinophagaceae bacterium]